MASSKPKTRNQAALDAGVMLMVFCLFLAISVIVFSK